MRFDEINNVYVSSDGTNRYTPKEVVYSDVLERHILRKYALLTDDGKITSRKAARMGSGGYVRVMNSAKATIYTNAVYCNEGVWQYKEKAFYFEPEDKFYAHERNVPDYSRIMYYHDTKSLTRDISQNSQAKVGYEIEKNSFVVNGKEARRQRDKVGNYRIFRGYETDSSCGVEAITHILPLDKEYFGEVEAMINEAAEVIDSPSDGRCGGHINISHTTLNPEELLNKMRPHVGLLYAMFPSRLQTRGNNTRLLQNSGGSRRTSAFNVKGNYIEVRLPSGVRNTASLIMRHKVMSALLECATTGSDNVEFIEMVTPILTEYFGDKTGAILKLARDFQGWIDDGKKTGSIITYIHSDLKDEERRAERARNIARAAEIRAAQVEEAEEWIRTEMPNKSLLMGRGFYYNPRSGGYRGRFKIILTAEGLKSESGYQYVGGTWANVPEILLRNTPVHHFSDRTSPGVRGRTEDRVLCNWILTDEGTENQRYVAHIDVNNVPVREPVQHEFDYLNGGKVENGILSVRIGNGRPAGFHWIEGDTVSVRRWRGPTTWFSNDAILVPDDDGNLAPIDGEGEGLFAQTTESLSAIAESLSNVQERMGPAPSLSAIGEALSNVAADATERMITAPSLSTIAVATERSTPVSETVVLRATELGLSTDQLAHLVIATADITGDIETSLDIIEGLMNGGMSVDIAFSSEMSSLEQVRVR